MTRDPLTLVLDESELREGLCVELRPCQWCGKKERFILLAEVLPFLTTVDHAGVETITTARTAWRMAVRCGRRGPDQGVLLDSIENRKLYRLIDDDAAADETTTTRRKERVR